MKDSQSEEMVNVGAPSHLAAQRNPVDSHSLPSRPITLTLRGDVPLSDLVLLPALRFLHCKSQQSSSMCPHKQGGYAIHNSPALASLSPSLHFQHNQPSLIPIPSTKADSQDKIAEEESTKSDAPLRQKFEVQAPQRLARLISLI